MSNDRKASLLRGIGSCAGVAAAALWTASCSMEPAAALVSGAPGAAAASAHSRDVRAPSADASAPSAELSAPSAELSAPSRDSQPADGELERSYAELDKAYQAAKREASEDAERRRKAGEKVTDADARNAAAELWPRFEALAARGSGHARLWMALEVPSAFKSRERALNQQASLKLLDEVVTQHADEPWIGELAKSVTALYIVLPEEEVDRIVDALAAKCSRKEVVAEALYRSAAFGKSSKRSGAAERADALMKRIQSQYADTEYGRKARGEVKLAVGLRIGEVAPDFTTEDADGVAFKLSDYRGKVVVLDFWGFW